MKKILFSVISILIATLSVFGNGGGIYAISTVTNSANPVELYTLLEQITCRKNVKVISVLDKSVEEKKGNIEHIYSDPDKKYLFRTRTVCNYYQGDQDTEVETFFYDGTYQFRFSDYTITCYPDNTYDCEDFGFNECNYLEEHPVILEICGKQFFYSEIYFPCNGIGCGQSLYIIYDLEEKRPTFISNFRLGYPENSFYISDFDNDGNPDLLIISKTEPSLVQENPGIYEYEVRLTSYSYEKGEFLLKEDAPYICLKGIGNYKANEDISPTFDLIENKWTTCE